MKFGQKLEQESVPEWSIHNVDYNSLKYEIKINTRRDQARAMAIPGHRDTSLARFEERFYEELCAQHDRVDLFVSSKAAEIASRLDYLEQAIARLTERCARAPPTLKIQRRLVKYQGDALRCGDDVQALCRFTNAQVEAFRKILKKYQKWTGSATLGDRFREHILSDPKSFTRRDLTHLRARHDAIRSSLATALPPVSPSSPESLAIGSPRPAFQALPPPAVQEEEEPQPQQQYWNEYDHGSEEDEGYTLYVTPDEEGFPGWGYISAPFARAKEWFDGGKVERRGEQAPLLRGASQTYSTSQPGSSTDGEELSSDDDLPREGYRTHYALPSVQAQHLQRYRSHMLLWATASCLAAAGMLTLIAAVLLFTGKRKRRVEVDAGVSAGVMAAAFAAVAAVGMGLARGGGWLWRVVVMIIGGGVLVLDSMLLVLVMER